jgi:hypothetical protein
MLLHESESSLETRVKTKNVLTFLAETVNLYNWYLRRSDAPYNKLYDETDDVMNKLYEELYKRAKEDHEVSIKLKEVVSVWNLNEMEGEYDAGVFEEEFERAYQSDVDKMNSHWWSRIVQRRQCGIMRPPTSFNQPNAEREQMMWEEVDGTTDAPELYARLIMLESEYIEILSSYYTNEDYDEYRGIYRMSHAERLIDNVEWGLTEYSELCPLFGVVDMELERVYVDTRLERVYLQDYHTNREGGDENLYNSMNFDADFHNAVNSSSSASAYEGEESRYEEGECGAVPELCVFDKHMVSELECPICYEAQESGDEGVRTMCGHEYCGPCFWSMVARKSECGMCRSVIREYVELTVV